MKNYLDALPEQGKAFYQQFNGKGKVVMLNLLRFRTKADYTTQRHLSPDQQISGRDAYKLYMQHTQPILERAGGQMLFMGSSGDFLIGPEAEKWDAVLLVEHQSVAAFMAFAQDGEYLKTAGHRAAALEDSRLLPMTQL